MDRDLRLSDASDAPHAGARGRSAGAAPPARRIARRPPGPSAEQREAVFERFRQLAGGSTRRFGGTGLGLAIAGDFTQLHGGTLDV
ncbi:MAG: hypothetical protein E6J69_17930, partial [Deltaproteobacteria bacterium]